ncbi:hypothetical protein MKP08_03845 [Erythrobacter sp. LQ02-29]|uniref:hypothetical protein n=1 Tax=Erythrobacter sp. LQ02-29 TaxID=2920384 RepID=UPI001F4EBD8C|nr:hypothetical protein [Erythrobacter sp. LQ02-29]MCP9221879.1 hypothetical protein [Erythrobacter sp. LQ02-29]
MAAMVMCGFGLSACSSEASAQPSLIGALQDTRPVVLCLEEASNDDAIRTCGEALGIGSDFEWSQRPRTLEEFTQIAVLGWFTFTRGAPTSITDNQFQNAIDYAKCVERETLALGRIEPTADPQNAIGFAKANVDKACADHPMSQMSFAARNPGVLTGDFDQVDEAEFSPYFLAASFASAAFNHAIESEGWVSEDMRPCFVTAKGQYSSDYCAKKARNSPRPAPPPPSLQARKPNERP